uniref:Proteasome activator complex subunit 4 C-terminal domain-containing protein n=1 Tax=Wuchereria bancrofti TaxID=6293 RepID=A0AAF5RV59_WUCBA
MQVAVFSNFFLFLHHRPFLQSVLCSMILDPKFEVREAAATTLSGLIHCHFFDVDHLIIDTFYEWSREENDTKRHAGVLALSAIVQAFPYSVPSFLPKILMQLCRHTCDKQPMQGTVKKALSEFKRTHQDNWHEHKMQFSEDQLSILTDLFVSPNYYV